MRVVGTDLSLSATDLSNFLSCRHRTALDMAAAEGKLKRPYRDDPLLAILQERGEEHEHAYVWSLADNGRHVVHLGDIADREERLAQTLTEMQAGTDVIVQGALRNGYWFGYPDVLQKVDRPSDLGAWSYEVTDAKLARETRAGTILQLGLYSEMLAAAQGTPPEHFYVVTPGGRDSAPGRDSALGTRHSAYGAIHTFRVNDYAAYFRLIRDQMTATVALGDDVIAAANYPEPVEHCDVCPWWKGCDDKRRADDHLSLVANVTRLQRRELESREMKTLTTLAGLPVPITFKPQRGSKESYERAQVQANLQLQSRGKVPPLHLLRLPPEEDQGLCRLPEPSPGDIFLDLEGDALAAEGGREYLFGVVHLGPRTSDLGPEYCAFWALDSLAERTAFEQVMDLIKDTLERDPNAHVYHYAPYEPSAFKRLAGRYASRERELDHLLRGRRFIDLYGVVRQGVVAGVESYSIKKLEALYGYARVVNLDDANGNLRLMEQALWLDNTGSLSRDVLDAVEGYNRDDCVSTLKLRDWLEQLRTELVEHGTPVPRPSVEPSEESEDLRERVQRVNELRGRLLAGITDLPAELPGEPHARWILAFLLDWHRREDKATWWEYFRLRELPDDDLLDEPQAIAGMTFVERVEVVRRVNTGTPTGSVIDRYEYPPQEMEITRGTELKLKDGKFGDVVVVDRARRSIDVKKGKSQADSHPASVFAHKYINPRMMEDAIFRLGEAGDLTAASAARDLLMRRPPRLRSGTFAQLADETATEFAVRLVGDLDRTVLAIQGPPGSGKTYTGARMIAALVKEGKKVGVTANSHKVIRNLLDAVAKAACELGVTVNLAHKVKEDEDDDEDDGAREFSAVKVVRENSEALGALQSGEANVLGATAWTWSRPEFAQSVDVLFVDEAGQMSLANAVAVSQAANSMVLLGDPQQLEQPRKGSHPDGVGVSALQHVLGDHKTIPAERGIFLPVTWRLSPSICAFTSELFYDRLLEPKCGLERQVLSGAGEFDGSGLYIIVVEHDGNRSSSQEEIEAVADLVSRLTTPGVSWVNEDGEAASLTGDCILVVAPYNAQVSRLAERLAGTGARVGTVDKFQGQEAPVVIYSMATSRPEDAPRGMEFLYSANRLNVATSRARCAAILVASPFFFEPECRSPRQMKLANGVCRYREMARNARHHETASTLRAIENVSSMV